MNKKRILLLGGTAIQIPIIEIAHKMGMCVITCDNKPQNPGHKLADEYYDVSITDNEAVLELATKLNVDAVVNFILEAGVQAAAYTHEKLGLPTSPYKSVHLLSNKKLFREYLKENGFCTPNLITCSNKEEAFERIATLQYPVVVKPTDLWGSRGVSSVNDDSELDAALTLAFENSRGADIIIEEFVEPDGAPIEGDAFAVDGILTTHVWADVYPDKSAPNPITPVCFCYPSSKSDDLQQKLNMTLQRLITLLDMQTNAYNIEARIDKSGNVFLMEVAPRNGSNATSDVTSLSTGKDIITGTLRAALGDGCKDLTDAPCNGFWLSYIVHSNISGSYQGMWYDKKFAEGNLYKYSPYIDEGEKVQAYSGTNCTIGMLVATFPTREEMMTVAKEPEKFFHPIIAS